MTRALVEDPRRARCVLCSQWVVWGSFFGISMALDLEPSPSGRYRLQGLSSAIVADAGPVDDGRHHARHRCRPIERTLR